MLIGQGRFDYFCLFSGWLLFSKSCKSLSGKSQRQFYFGLKNQENVSDFHNKLQPSQAIFIFSAQQPMWSYGSCSILPDWNLYFFLTLNMIFHGNFCTEPSWKQRKSGSVREKSGNFQSLSKMKIKICRLRLKKFCRFPRFSTKSNRRKRQGNWKPYKNCYPEKEKT